MMKSYILSILRCLVVALSVVSSSVGVADDAADGASVTTMVEGDGSSSLLADFLTLETILPVGVVLLALVVIARKRKVH